MVKERTKDVMNLLYKILVILIVVSVFLTIITNIKKSNKIEKDYEQLNMDYEYLQSEYNNMESQYLEKVEIQKTLTKDYEEVSSKLEELSKENIEYELELIDGYSEELYVMKYNKILDRHGKPNPIYEKYTTEEINYMARCIETEVYGCDFNARCNIASVIINRVNDSRFPNDPISVVTSPSQFAYHRTYVTEKTLLAIEYVVLFGDTAQGAIAFHSGGYSDTFNGWHYVFQDNAVHYFYK